MRITGGLARSIPIVTPKGDGTRPATDQMRERVFSSLGDAVEGAQCMDLFAGSGSYGLEALSRGAAEVTFVEKHPGTAKCISQNLKNLSKAMQATAKAQVRIKDVLTFEAQSAYDLIFIDPPYPILEKVAPTVLDKAADWSDNGLAILELPAEMELTHPQWTPVKRLGKGRGQSPTVLILQKMSGPLLA